MHKALRVLLETLAVLLVSAAPAAAQVCWSTGPAHGENGVDFMPIASTVWDAGTGPRLVVGPTVGTNSFGNVHYWEGGRWVEMPGVFNGSVYDLEVFNGSLYACGVFTQVGAATVNGIARWNGSAWVAVGNHIVHQSGTLRVHDMEVFNGQLWVGGSFGRAGASGYQYFAIWNGASWVGGGNQTNGEVRTFCIHNSELYAGVGTHGSGAGVSRWTGTAWQVVGVVDSFDDVYALASFNGQLIAGGNFTEIGALGGTPAQVSRIARLSGNTWLPLAGGLSPATGSDRIITMKVYNSRLYAAGRFRYMNGIAMNKIAAWDGSSWSDVAGGIDQVFNPPTDNDAVWALELFDNQLIAMGMIDRAGGTMADGIARYNGSSWLPFVEGINGRIRTFLRTGNGVYAGGDFVFDWEAQGAFNHLLRADGSTLNSLASIQTGGRGTSGNVLSLGYHTFSLVQGPRLIIGGAFSSAGGINASNIVSYHLQTTLGYVSLGAGLNGPVSAVASYGSAVWAAGNFSASGSTPLWNVGRYTGGNWVSPGPWMFPQIHAMMVHDGRLVIGGLGNGTNGVSAFDGSTLHDYGAANGAIRAMATYEGDLIVAGDFSMIGGVSANRIARRSSITGQWMPLGAGLGGQGLGNVLALALHRGDLYAGGTFVQSGITPLYRLARWNGSFWQPVPWHTNPGGLDGPVYALASIAGELHIGGDFSKSTNGAVSPYWIRYVCEPCYANCDNSILPPVLNVDDFTCFINSFAQASSLAPVHQITHRANCDGSTATPVLNVDDFTCFINEFAQGCN